MSKYNELDALIIEAVTESRNPLYDFGIQDACVKLAKQDGREVFRVMDGRLQALRKAGRIRYTTKALSGDGIGGWKLCNCKL